MTTEWYKNYYANNPVKILEFSQDQIKEYMDMARTSRLTWAH